MASIYKRAGSRFWWIKYRDKRTGKLVRESTGIDIATHNSRRKAKEMESEKTRDEFQIQRIRENERWESWAQQYFEAKYADKATLSNALNAWKELIEYFRDVGVVAPRQVDYNVASKFQIWRDESDVIARLGKINKNTARQRGVYFRVLMAEAVRRGLTDFNPCRDVKMRGEPTKEKKEITVDDEKTIVAMLESQQEWMQQQWKILMLQGCRIAETDVPLTQIDTKAMTIRFLIKGGRHHTAPLHPLLLPIIKKAKADGRTSLLDSPPDKKGWSSRWIKFFKGLGMPYSIHCTRVTVITRLARADHPIAKICLLVGHGEEVNRIYRKLKPSDSSELLATLGDVSIP